MPQEALVCPQCGAPQRDESFCPHCGTRLRERSDLTVRVFAEQPKGVACFSCGKQLGDVQSNCPHCGHAQFWQCTCSYKWNRSNEPYCQNCGRPHVDVQEEIRRRDRMAQKGGAIRPMHVGLYVAVLFGAFGGLGAVLLNSWTGALLGIGVAAVISIAAVVHFGSG